MQPKVVHIQLQRRTKQTTGTDIRKAVPVSYKTPAAMLIVKYGKRLGGDRGKQKKKNGVSIFDCHYGCLYRFDSGSVTGFYVLDPSPNFIYQIWVLFPIRIRNI